jgi:hypothetical protein
MTMIVLNPKGRAVSVICAVVWVISIIMLLLKGDWSLGPMLLLLLFALLMALTSVRLYQEWKEDGEWLD